MAGLDHAASARPVEPPSRWRSGLGLVLFAVYLLVYTGFVLLNAFAPTWMEITPWAGVNLAVLYGLGLIVLAFVLAIVYDAACRLMSRSSASSSHGLSQQISGSPGGELQ